MLPDAVPQLPRRRLGWWPARIAARLRRARLDAALAEGADPWAGGAVMVRAARLGSLGHRRLVALRLVHLVAAAERQVRPSPYLPVRHRRVLEHRAELLALAGRLARPAPVEIAVVARLTLLVTESDSPVYAGGADPRRLRHVVSRCLVVVAD